LTFGINFSSGSGNDPQGRHPNQPATSPNPTISSFHEFGWDNDNKKYLH